MSTPLIRPVEHHHRNLRAHVEQALSAAIITGELEPGTLLTVPTLAAQFEVSATPVREAVLDLESRGFVESVRNKGFRVTEVSPESLRQIAEVRQLLEPPAMEQLARNFPADELPGLRSLAADIVSGARTGETSGLRPGRPAVPPPACETARQSRARRGDRRSPIASPAGRPRRHGQDRPPRGVGRRTPRTPRSPFCERRRRGSGPDAPTHRPHHRLVGRPSRGMNSLRLTLRSMGNMLHIIEGGDDV